MPRYRVRFDEGPSETFDAIDDAAAREEVRAIISDSLEEDAEGSLYRLDGGRGEEEYIGEVSLDDDDE